MKFVKLNYYETENERLKLLLVCMHVLFLICVLFVTLKKELNIVTAQIQ